MQRRSSLQLKQNRTPQRQNPTTQPTRNTPTAQKRDTTTTPGTPPKPQGCHDDCGCPCDHCLSPNELNARFTAALNTYDTTFSTERLQASTAHLRTAMHWLKAILRVPGIDTTEIMHLHTKFNSKLKKYHTNRTLTWGHPDEPIPKPTVPMHAVETAIETAVKRANSNAAVHTPIVPRLP
eukprot:3776622-Rhodomonas_salina.1